MSSLIYLAGAAFAVCYLATPLVRDALLKAGLVDRPDQARKRHREAVPRLGGIPILLAVAAALAIFARIEGGAFAAAVESVLPLVPAALLVFVVGVADDLWDLNAWIKLAGQFTAAAWLWFAGLRIDSVAGQVFSDDPWVTFPLTVGWLLAATNAFNLIDGIDGLAAGVGLFATTTILLSALLKGDPELQILTIPLAAALLAFLRYNFNPATIFLGDSGAMLIGFLLGGYSVLWSHKSATLLAMTAPVFALAFPIAETGVSVVRRWLRGAPIFGADRGHIHHRLLEQGMGPRQAAMVLYGVSALGAAVSLVVAEPAIRERGLAVLLFAVIAAFGFRRLGYTEFASAKHFVWGGEARRLLAADIRARNLAAAMESAESFDDCWAALQTGLTDFGFRSVELRSENRHKRSLLQPEESEDSWTLEIPLPEINAGACMRLERAVEGHNHAYVLDPVIDAIRKTIPARLAGESPL